MEVSKQWQEPITTLQQDFSCSSVGIGSSKHRVDSLNEKRNNEVSTICSGGLKGEGQILSDRMWQASGRLTPGFLPCVAIRKKEWEILTGQLEGRR